MPSFVGMSERAIPGARPAASDPLVGVTRRSATPLALWLWNVLRHRSAADRWHVLTAALASVNQQAVGRVEAHLRVLHRFRGNSGEVLSRRTYTRWRDQQADRERLPSATAVARTFGGWPGAAEAIGQTVRADVLARRLTRQGPAITPADLNNPGRGTGPSVTPVTLAGPPRAGDQGTLRALPSASRRTVPAWHVIGRGSAPLANARREAAVNDGRPRSAAARCSVPMPTPTRRFVPVSGARVAGVRRAERR